VQYAPDTFALYEGLFKEAHDALIKEAKGEGMFRRFVNLFRSPADEKLMQQLAHQEAATKGLTEELASKSYDEALHLGNIDRLTKEVEQLGARPGALTEAQQAATQAGQTAEQARRGRNIALGVGGAGLGVGLPAAYYMGQQRGEKGKTRTRNLAFGAGAAAGIAAPQLIRGLGHIARGAGSSGAFPELEGAGYY
jgi:hypothetical protein